MIDFDEYCKLPIEIEITTFCMLECPKCARQKPNRKELHNLYMSTEDFDKMCKTFTNIVFCGILGDAIYHPKFHEFLQIALDNNIESLVIKTNGHGKNDKWWNKTIELSRKFKSIKYIIALDGLPEESCLYRINQDGETVFERMKQLVNNGIEVEWQYIVFKYNEDHIEEAKQMAIDNGMGFLLFYSSKWNHSYQPLDLYKPKNKDLYLERDIIIDKNVNKIYPKCLQKNTLNTPVFIMPGYFYPCCDHTVDTGLNKPHLLLSNVKDIKTEIFQSKEWTEFFDSIINNHSCAPQKCKQVCKNPIGTNTYIHRQLFKTDLNNPDSEIIKG